MSVSGAAQAAAQPIGFLPYLESKLDLNLLEDLAKKLVTYAEGVLPGATGPDKKAYCVKQAITVLEAFDNKIPVIGQWLDLPISDWLEAYAVGVLVDWAFLAVFGPDKAAKLQAAAQNA